MKLSIPPRLLQVAERLLEVDLSDKSAVTPRTLAVWGASVLFHAALVLALGSTVVFSSARVGGVRALRVSNAQFQAYEGRFGAEETDGQKMFQVPTRMEMVESALADGTAPVAEGDADGQRENNVLEKLRLPETKLTPSPSAPNRVVGVNSFFGMRVEGHVIVFVIDVSGSMYEKTGTVTRLARVLGQLEQTVWSLSAEQQFNIVLFATRAAALSPAPLNATEENKRRASAWLAGGVDCGGTTNMSEGLLKALMMKPEMIMLLTDGEADSSAASIKSQVALLRKRFCPSVRICSVGFYLEPDSEPERLLRELSASARGAYLRLEKGK